MKSKIIDGGSWHVPSSWAESRPDFKKVFKDLVIKFGFTVEESFEFDESYAQTLHQWLNNFDAVTKELKELGFPEIFIYKWRFYLAYCIAVFKAY